MDPISMITGLASTIINKIWPDKTEQQKQQFLLEFNRELATTDLAKNQILVNQNEASNTNLFVAGWRPFIGWICGVAFAWQFIIQPITTYCFALSGHPLPALPVLDHDALNAVLYGMLGLGAYRTYEKVRGTK